jgi:hypothetical protein
MKKYPLSKTKEELLLTTIRYYHTDGNPRGVRNNGCSYITLDGHCCAIGRELSVNKAHIFEELNGRITQDYLFSKLPIRLQRLGSDYLGHIQSLHDTFQYWKNNKLTPAGIAKIRSIIKIYKLKISPEELFDLINTPVEI